MHQMHTGIGLGLWIVILANNIAVQPMAHSRQVHMDFNVNELLVGKAVGLES